MFNSIKKIFMPNKVIVFLLFNIGMGLLIYVFFYHLEETYLAYIAYLLSAYALIIFIIWLYKACQFSTNFIKESKIYTYYKNNFKLSMKATIIFSFMTNLILGITKLVLGIYYKSFWFITFAVYYLLLCIMRISLLTSNKKVAFGTSLEMEYKKLKQTGFILLFLNIILAGMIILIIHQNQAITYPGYLIYLVALYDFYVIIVSFINIFKYRKRKSPILIASKCINFAVAMISLISLEVAMIEEFGSNTSNFKQIMTSYTGFGICLINSFMAINIIIRSTKHLKTKNE